MRSNLPFPLEEDFILQLDISVMIRDITSFDSHKEELSHSHANHPEDCKFRIVLCTSAGDNSISRRYQLDIQLKRMRPMFIKA
jgi:hypothetical protein